MDKTELEEQAQAKFEAMERASLEGDDETAYALFIEWLRMIDKMYYD